MLKYIALVFAAVVASVLFAITFLILTEPRAHAHDWYTGLRNEKNQGCCGGLDCGPIAESAVTPVPGGYQVDTDDFKGIPIHTFIPNARAKPAKEGGDYHLCYWGGEVKCFFFPAPSF